MIFNMTGGQKKENPLNFEIVGGTTQPSKPTENMIWINTSTEITRWVFRADQPSSPSTGMVWVKIGESSEVNFNALKENEIRICPLSAKQYASGNWNDVSAEIYQNGRWVQWVKPDEAVYLYNAGNEYTSLTGNWEQKDASGGTNKQIQKNAADITVSVAQTSGASRQECIAGTSNQVDLTKYKTAYINVSYYDHTNGSGEGRYSEICRFGVYGSSIDSITDYVVINNAGIISLDISNLSGSYYVFFGLKTDWPSSTDNSNFANCVVTQVYLE